MTFRYLSALCLLWVSTLSLLGCGGGADTQNAASGNSGGSSATSPVQAGVYFASISGQNFWGVITPGNRWYGLHEKTNGYDIYSGDLSGVGALNASVAALKYQNNAANNFGGTANFTSTDQGKISGTLTLASNVIIQPVSFINAATTHSFTNTPTASLSDIAGTWTGELSYGLGVITPFTVTIDAASGSISAPSFNNCTLNSSTSSATTIVNANLFALTLNTTINGSSTGCDTKLNNKIFNGVTYLAPSNGVNQRLIWVATDSDGYAIAFKAAR